MNITSPRIGIDLHVASGLFQGSRTHCLELFSRVVAITPECDFIVFSENPGHLISFSSNFRLPNVLLVEMPHKSAPIRLIWQLPRLARRYNLSLLHTQYIAPPLTRCPTAVTIHDILFESHPQYFDRAFVYRSRLLVPRSARRSVTVFTVSDFSEQQIHRIYGIPREKVHIIPNGVDLCRFFPGELGRDFVPKLGLSPREYYLTVGRLEPRKNHIALLQAWSNLRSPRPKLAIVGQRHFGYSDVISLISSLHLESDVLLFENISDDALPTLYRNARGFLYCSWAEGFGMPLLEAMASGVPVISSRNTALEEVGSEAVLYADPSQPQDISEKIELLERDASLRENLISGGLERAGHYTWESSAQTVRMAYLEHFGLSSYSR